MSPSPEAPAGTEKPLAQPYPWDAVARGYEKSSRAFMEQFSLEALGMLSSEGKLAPGSRLLDVACGPGTTTLLCAEHVAHIDAVDFSSEMLAILRDHVQRLALHNVTLHECDGQDLPFSDGCFDYAVSMFGLMFFPDRILGMRELLRTLVPGGRAVISSWAPMHRSTAFTALFDAVHVIDPSRPRPSPDPTSLENPDVFRGELEQAGFANIVIHEVEKDMRFDSPDEFWDRMAEGAVPLVLMRKQVGEAQYERNAELAKERLRASLGDTRVLRSIAYLATAEKPS